MTHHYCVVEVHTVSKLQTDVTQTQYHIISNIYSAKQQSPLHSFWDTNIHKSVP